MQQRTRTTPLTIQPKPSDARGALRQEAPEPSIASLGGSVLAEAAQRAQAERNYAAARSESSS